VVQGASNRLKPEVNAALDIRTYPNNKLFLSFPASAKAQSVEKTFLDSAFELIKLPQQ